MALPNKTASLSPVRISANGFIVLKESTAVLEAQSSISGNYKALRDDLIRQGVMLKSNELYVFAQDYTFSSPSMAASVLLGRNANGRIEWKNQDGKSLNDLAAEDVDCDTLDGKIP